jgi:hypothetical protein
MKALMTIEIGGKAPAHVVAVEHVYLVAGVEQGALGSHGERGLARGGKAREPNDAAAVAVAALALGAANELGDFGGGGGQGVNPA